MNQQDVSLDNINELLTSKDGVVVKKASEHNLKGIDVFIPRNKLTVITGLSGSGKSSLAFDTIYAEGQRRYIEGLSAYSRSFLEQMKKPQVESIQGLSPTIAIDQKSINPNPRSTVGTVSEVYDFLRLLYSRVGTPLCPIHKTPVMSQSLQQIFEDIKKLPSGSKYFLLAPVARQKKGEFLNEFQKWEKKGYTRARVDGQWIELKDAKKLAKRQDHDIEILIDRLIIEDKYDSRLKESISLALSLTDGLVSVEVLGEKSKLYSIHRACSECGYSFPEIEPRLFSFNNPRGACEDCNGLGYIGFDDQINNEDDEQDDDAETRSIICGSCNGKRLNEQALNVQLCGFDISEMSSWPIVDLKAWFNKKLIFNERDRLVSEKIINQIQLRLEYLERVGTGYLSLNRGTGTLSGGEAQRIRLASQVGSALVGVLYVLDEPSIGLHPRDHRKLLDILKEIKNRGNTVLLVEHDEETIMSADYLIDIGPGAGIHGGNVMAQGTPKQVMNHPNSLTGAYLSKVKKINWPSIRRKGNGKTIKIKGARGNNLKDVDLEIPLGTFVGISGVSGSGKSTLIMDTLYKSLSKEINGSLQEPAPFESIDGIDHIDKVIHINQKPIGRTPRSIPATYVGVFPLIRELFSNLPESKLRGFKPGHFSFNIKGGRCETCSGGGQIKVEMHFLSEVYVTCDSCLGKRYSKDTLNIKFKDKNINDVLNMSVEEASKFFEHHYHISNKLETLNKVGLGYITLGQSSTTLSGGEAQRVKLSKELSKRSTGKTFYILDEPTTGLHFEDVGKLISLLHDLVEQGNTVVVIEHQLDVLRNCDYLIDLGPEGGRAGGEIIGQGTPETLSKNKKSITGSYLFIDFDSK